MTLMKRFTYQYALLVLLLTAITSPASAQELKATDFFGKWHFTANVEITDAGQAYKDEFQGDYDVVIASNIIYEMMITGIGGGTAQQPVNKIDNEAHQLNIINPNGSNSTMWKHAVITSPDGKNPYGTKEGNYRDGFHNFKLTFDPVTKEITIPDFAAVAPDANADYPELYAKFTNCKMTLVSQEVIEVEDISGEYKFTAEYYEGSDYTFNMSVVATSATFDTYNVTLTIDGYNQTTVPATWDGYLLTLQFDNVFLDDAKTVAVSSMSDLSNRQVTWAFKKVSEKLFYMNSEIAFSTKEGEEYRVVQPFNWDGRMVKQVEMTDRSGTYTFKASVFNLFTEDADDAKRYTADVTMTIKFSELAQKYFITELMGNDTYTLNYGGIGCNETADGNLEADLSLRNYVAMVSVNDDYTEMVYDKLYNALGDTNQPIKIVFNEDGTVTVDGFLVVRQRVTYDENYNATTTTVGNIAYWADLKGGIQKVTYDGTFTASPAVFELYDQSLADALSPSFDITITYNETVDRYFVTKLMGNDTYSLNYGGIPVNLTDEGAELNISSANYLKLLSVNDDYTEMEYLKIFDADNQNASPIKVTYNGDGTVTLGNFYVQRIHVTYDADYNATTTATTVAYYGDTATGIKRIAATKAPASEAVYDLSGRKVTGTPQHGLYIVGGRKVMVK